MRLSAVRLHAGMVMCMMYNQNMVFEEVTQELTMVGWLGGGEISKIAVQTDLDTYVTSFVRVKVKR